MSTHVPPLPVPATPQEWHERRAAIRATLTALLGELPPDIAPQVETLSVERRDGLICERFRFDNGDPLGGPGRVVTGYLVLPERLSGPAPALQYCHWHGGEYALGKEELWRPGSRGLTPAQELAGRGYVVLAIDAYGFGERSGTGPDGREQRGGAEEASWAKWNLWHGRTLWGMMLRDERLALTWLCSRPEIDAGRVGALGISMGSTRTWWHMGLDERVRCGVGVACLTRYQELIAAQGLHQHGIYFFVPGLLRHFDVEAVVGLCAPRPLLCLNGDRDAGSPPKGIEIVSRSVAGVYAALNAPERFRSVIYPGVGHEWTPEMWAETHNWLARFLPVPPL